MSADLFAAFGTESFQKEKGHTEEAIENTKGESALVDTDTWQPWPKRSSQATQLSAEEGLWRLNEGGTDVLFDADEEDFGDFEKARSDQQRSISVLDGTFLETGVDLLGLDEVHFNKEKLTNQPHTMIQISSLLQSTVLNSEPDDDWGAFEDTQVSETGFQTQSSYKQIVETNLRATPIPKDTRSDKMGVSQTQIPAPNTNDDWDEWNELEGVTIPVSETTKTNSAVPTTKQERPMNVPPPAVLLSLTPKVLSSLSTDTTSPIKSTETSYKAVQVYRVSARLIAGRSMRWKRDTILAQSMRIGAAGRSGGMKLTVLDKGESRKEEQEVEETLTAWSRYSLKLNAAMAKAKVQRPPLSLSSNISVRTATGSDIVNASHPCPICGLRRNERINGIDMNVSDTFGEFWVEHWGHKDCHDFWYQYENLLNQR